MLVVQFIFIIIFQLLFDFFAWACGMMSLVVVIATDIWLVNKFFTFLLHLLIEVHLVVVRLVDRLQSVVVQVSVGWIHYALPLAAQVRRMLIVMPCFSWFLIHCVLVLVTNEIV